MFPRSNEAISNMLNEMHDSNGLSWERMGVKLGVPGGTLWDVAHGKPVPRKWRRRVFRDLFAMPKNELLWALNNREEL